MKLTIDNIGLALPIPAPALSNAVLGFVDAALAENTRRAYRGDLADFLE